MANRYPPLPEQPNLDGPSRMNGLQITRAFDGVGRDAKLLFASSFIGGVSYAFYYLIVPFYLLSAGYDATWIGIANAAFGVSTTVLITPAGMLADALGRKMFNVIGYVVMSLGMIIMAMSPSELPIIGGATIAGFGGGDDVLLFGCASCRIGRQDAIDCDLQLLCLPQHVCFVSRLRNRLGSRDSHWLSACEQALCLADNDGRGRDRNPACRSPRPVRS